jgi:hypothetical protein
MWIYKRDDTAGRFVLSGWAMDTLWVPLERGWNIIGAPINAVPNEEISTEPPGALISGVCFEWLAGAFSPGEYIEVDSLNPGRGHWVISRFPAELYAPYASRWSEKAGFDNEIFDIYGASPPPPPGFNGEIEMPTIPREFSVGIFPNPFNSACQITAFGEVEIFDISGRLVRKFKNGNSSDKGSGKVTYLWDACDSDMHPLPTGIYLVKPASGKAMKALLIR